MKNFLKILTVLLGLSVVAPEVDARASGGSGRGNARSSASNQRSAPKRSPMTGSKIQRPTSRPQPKPASRPVSRPTPKASRPATKPAARPTPQPKPTPKPAPKPVQRPSVQKPASRPDKMLAKRPDFSRPSDKPAPSRPAGKPDLSRPSGKPDNSLPNAGSRPTRPDTKPMPRPVRPDKNRPSTLPGMVTYPDRPGKPGGGDRPANGNRPGNGDRPGIANRPGNGNLPGIGGGLGNANNNRPDLGNSNRPDRGGIGNNSGNNIGKNNGNRVGNKIDNSSDRNRFNNSKNVHIDKVNVNRRNVGLNRPSTLPARDRNWNSNKWGGNSGIWGNNNNIKINNNVQINNRYSNNFNYAYRPNYWGARPWWGAGNNHGWHHGHWNYGYNSGWYHGHSYYNDNNFAAGFMWGIAVWSLGNMVYDMGYQSYKNPYPAPPVQYNTYNTYNTGDGSNGGSKSAITYDQPISVTAAAAPPGDEEATKLAETKSDEALERSRVAFKNGDYVAALKADEEAIGYTPGDSTLHEYRALCLFALGKYGEAAGVLNPVLASGPGWGWDTMTGFYPSSSVYDGQLRKLEAYVKGTPDKADGHFLLGYHYLVCGHIDKAYEQFSRTVELQPADGIARQLRDLMKDSLPDQGAAESEGPAPEAPAPIPSEKLVGTWVSQPGTGGKITFKMEEGGDFIWSFVDGDKTTELKGTYGLDDKGLLVLTTEDSQMVSSVALPQDSEMKFTLVGSPDGDPGLDFKKG